jgi:SNF2 family DNA or RNA helicase
LRWDPRLPLTGELDRLATLQLAEGVEVRKSASIVNLERRFRDGIVDPLALGDLERRHELLQALHKALNPVRRQHPIIDAVPAARAVVAEELERVVRRRRNQAQARSTLARLRSLKRKLYPYQWHGVERFLDCGRLLLADDMGLGKTTQAIACCHALFEAGRVHTGVIIVPASLKPQWLREWQETTRVPAAILDGGPEERARAYREHKKGFLIINYEQLLRDAEQIQRLAPQMVVLDEAQRIKNYASKSAVYVKALAPEFRLVLTGTPMENRLEELASILDWVDDVALAPKWRLVPWYTLWEGDGSRGKVGARHLDTLRSRMATVVVRRVRREVLEQLPPRTDTRVPVAMTPQQREEHDALRDPIVRLSNIARQRPLSQQEFLRLMASLTQQRIISNGLGQLFFDKVWPTYRNARPDPALVEGLFAPKLVELRSLVYDLAVEQQRKLVIFSQWRRMLRLADWSLRDVLTDAGLRSVFFTGAERPSQRTRSIVDFHDDPRVRVMFLSDAGGIGLNLQKASNCCINLELPWNPAVLEQRIGRIYRIGQKQPIDVYNLISEYGIEARIAGIVGAKQALFTNLFDGASEEVRFDAAASFLTQVHRIVDPGVLPEAPQAVNAAKPEAEDADLPQDSGDSGLADAALADELGPAPQGDALERAAADGNGSRATAGATEQLFAALRVERTDDGGVRIEAPPEAAASLLGLFEGMAKLLSNVARPPN